ncbi:hypothetical protein ACTA71_002342 [Dictyostelium dimigraforme]
MNEANPKSLDEAINVARLKANSKYKCENIGYYNAGFINKYVEVNKGIIAPVEQQLEQPTKVMVPTTSNYSQYNIKEENSNYVNHRKPQFNSNEEMKRVSFFGVFSINDQKTRCLVDTGSTMVHHSFAKQLNLDIESCNNDLRAANRTKINMVGKTSIKASVDRINYTIHNVYITKHFEFNA